MLRFQSRFNQIDTCKLNQDLICFIYSCTIASIIQILGRGIEGKLTTLGEQEDATVGPCTMIEGLAAPPPLAKIARRGRPHRGGRRLARCNGMRMGFRGIACTLRNFKTTSKISNVSSMAHTPTAWARWAHVSCMNYSAIITKEYIFFN